MKILYLRTLDVVKKWTMPYPNWSLIRGKLDFLWGMGWDLWFSFWYVYTIRLTGSIFLSILVFSFSRAASFFCSARFAAFDSFWENTLEAFFRNSCSQFRSIFALISFAAAIWAAIPRGLPRGQASSCIPLCMSFVSWLFCSFCYIIPRSRWFVKWVDWFLGTIIIAEIELFALGRQCIADNRIPDLPSLRALLKPWATARNATQKGVDWHFTTVDARFKLKHLYPIINI